MQNTTERLRPAPVAVHALGRGFLLIGWTGSALMAAGRLKVVIDGTSIRPPFSRISLPLTGSSHRNLLAVRCVAPSRPVLTEIFQTDGNCIARGEAYPPTRGHPCDAHALLSGMNAGEQARLARFLLEVCCPLFKLSGDPTFLASVRELLSEISAGDGLLAPRCTLTSETLFCEGVMPEAIGERLSAVLISAEAISRLAIVPTPLPAPQTQPTGRSGLGMVVPTSVSRRGTTLVVFGEHGLISRTLGPVHRRLPSAHTWIARFGDQKPHHRRYLLDALARGFRDTPAAAALLRELRALSADAVHPASAHPAPAHSAATPSGAVRISAQLIVGCRSGLYISGSLADPHRLAYHIEVERQGVVRSVATNHLARFSAGASDGERSGFAVFVDENDATAAQAPVRLSLVMGSGNRIEFGEGPALLTPREACEAVLASLPPDGPDATVLSCVEPAVRSLLDELLEEPTDLDLADVGLLPNRPLVSVVMPFTGEPDLLRCRASLLAGDPEIARAELVYLVDCPTDRKLAERQAAETWAAFGLAARLVAFGHQPLPGAMLNAAIAACRGEFVAILGRTALPEAPGWIGRLASFLAGPRRGIVGPQALYPDHSLVCAGEAIGRDDDGRWGLRPQLAGFPRDYPPAAVASRVDVLPPDCLFVSRSLLHALHGFNEDYLLASSAAADLCLKARARGLEVWRLPDPAFFRIEALGTTESSAAAGVRLELDRRLLEQRWHHVQPVASRQLLGQEPQPIRPGVGAADVATQKAA